MRKSSNGFGVPEISVVIVSFNTKDLTLNCLKSLVRESSFEIIVVDNASTDGSSGAVKSLYPEVLIVNNDSNTGFSKANNQGLTTAKGTYTIFLNSDTRAEPLELKKLVSYLKQHDEVGLVGPKLLREDGSVQPSCFNFPSVIDTLNSYWFRNPGFSGGFVPKGNGPTLVDAVVGACLVGKTSILKQICGFDEKFFFYFEDIDLCRRMKNIGKTIFYIPQSKIVHLLGASGLQNERFSFLKESLLYPIKFLLGSWKPSKSQEFLLESSIHYHGWLRHLLITCLIKFSPKTKG